VHGGAWRVGDKAMGRVVDNKTQHWLREGILFISINYRMLPERDALQQRDDVIAALVFAQAHASEWGGGGDDLIVGSEVRDYLDGDAGNDVLLGGDGDDSLWGGTHTEELIRRDGAKKTVVIDVRGGRSDGSYVLSDYGHEDDGESNYTINDLDRLDDGNDFISGGDGSDYGEGGGGDDVLYGSYGNDTLQGDRGGDYLSGGEGDDTLHGDYSVNHLNVFAPDVNGNYADFLDGGAGNDTLRGGYGADQLYGGAGNDFLLGDSWYFVLSAGERMEGDDFLDGGEGADTLIGGGGRDRLIGGEGADLLYGDDSEGLSQENSAEDYLTGGSGNDTLVGGAAADILFGDDDDDELYGDNDSVAENKQGDDTLDGGKGNDYLRGYGGNDTLIGSEGDDTLVGESGDDVLVGGDGDDAITSGDGDDTLVAGGGVDSLNGGAGDDLFIVNAGDGVSVDGQGDVVSDSAGSNRLQINGAGRSDLHIYASSNSRDAILQYGESDFVYIVDGMRGAISAISAGGESVNFETLIGETLATPRAFYGTDGADTVYGGSANDYLGGSLGSDELFGGAGDDVIEGGDAADRLIGGAGIDLLRGGAGNDTYILTGGGEVDAIDDAEGNSTIVLDGINSSAVSVTPIYGSSDLGLQYGADSYVTIIGGQNLPDFSIQFADRTMSLRELMAIAADVPLSNSGELPLGGPHLIGQDGSNFFSIAQNQITFIDSNTEEGIETVILPATMSLDQFTVFRDGDNLILASLVDDTVAVVRNYYQGQPEGRQWQLSAESEPALLLSDWMAGHQLPANSSYAQSVDNARFIFDTRQRISLTMLGAQGYRLNGERIVVGPTSSYDAVLSFTFSGVTSSEYVLGSNESPWDTSYGTVESLNWNHGVESIVANEVSTQTEWRGVAGIPDLTAPTSSPPSLWAQLPTAVAAGYGGIGFSYSVPMPRYYGGIVVQNRVRTFEDPVLGFDIKHLTSDSPSVYLTDYLHGRFRGTVTLGDGENQIWFSEHNYEVSYVSPELGLDNYRDYIRSSRSSDYVTVDHLGAFIEAGNGNNEFHGTSVNDTFAVGSGYNVLHGAAGADTYYVSMTGGGLTTIYDLDTWDGSLSSSQNSVYGNNTLVLPVGVTPESLRYQWIESPTYTAENNERMLVLSYEDSTVRIQYYAVESDIMGVQHFQFADGSILQLEELQARMTAITQPHLTIAGVDIQLGVGQFVSAASLVSATGLDADGALWYQIEDMGFSTGVFNVNGFEHESGGSIFVRASDWDDVQFGIISEEVGVTDQINIRAFDGVQWSPFVQTTITTIPIVPQPRSFSASISEDAAFVISSSALLRNDSMFDRDTYVVRSVSNAQHGTVVLDNNTGLITFTPEADYSGLAQFEYTVGEEGSEWALPGVANLTLVNINDAPVVNVQLVDAAATENALFSYSIPGDTFADLDQGDVLSYTAQRSDGGALPSWLGFDATTRTFSGAPGNEDVGELEIQITAIDSAGASVSDLMLLTVNVGPNIAPEFLVGDGGADEVLLETTIDNPVEISFEGLLEHVTDADGDVLSIAGVSDPQNGFVEIDWEVGIVLFMPYPGFSGEAQFNFQVSDGLTTSSFSVDVSVEPPVVPAVGSAGNDFLMGMDGDDLLLGYGGSDFLYGGGGLDTLVGGAGDDVYIMEDADVIVEAANEGFDVVLSASSFSLPDNVEALALADDVSNWPGVSIENLEIDSSGIGNNLDNMIIGNRGDNFLDGGAGADQLDGGVGNDTYVMDRGNAADLIVDTDSTTGNADVLSFLAGVATDQLWFRHVGNNLEVSIIGTSDSATIEDWYLGTANHIEQFKTADGQTLLDSQVENLVSAMAAFSPPSAGQTTLPQSYQEQLGAVIAANWQ